MIFATPWWVWGILAYLIFVGIKATRTHTLSLPKLFIIPLILIALKYTLFFSKQAILYVGCIGLGFALGWMMSMRMPLKILKQKKAIELPGTYVTLVLFLGFFLIKYVFGYWESDYVELFLKYEWLNLIVTGVFSGYFLGRACCYVYRYYVHREK